MYPLSTIEGFLYQVDSTVYLYEPIRKEHTLLLEEVEVKLVHEDQLIFSRSVLKESEDDSISYVYETLYEYNLSTNLTRSISNEMSGTGIVPPYHSIVPYSNGYLYYDSSTTGQLVRELNGVNEVLLVDINPFQLVLINKDEIYLQSYTQGESIKYNLLDQYIRIVEEYDKYTEVIYVKP